MFLMTPFISREVALKLPLYDLSATCIELEILLVLLCQNYMSVEM